VKTLDTIPMPATPNCDLVAENHDRLQAARDALDALEAEDIHLFQPMPETPDAPDGWYREVYQSEREKLLLRWIGVDPRAREEELQALLDAQRQLVDRRKHNDGKA
jgi:hypothetical protein